jgi:hypothetical protein
MYSSSAHTEYKLNWVPRILSISLIEFRAYWVLAELISAYTEYTRKDYISTWIMVINFFFANFII